MPAPTGALPLDLLGSRVVVISDFNCPYCFTLNEWLTQLGLADRVRWVGVEHKPHLPSHFADGNDDGDLGTLQREVADVRQRAPDLGVQLPPVWVNSRRALLLQAALEAEEPGIAWRFRRAIFRWFWLEGANIASPEVLESCLAESGVDPALVRFLDDDQLDGLTHWWRDELDRIPCLLAPTGARHLGLQDLPAVTAFVLGALSEPPPAPGCR